MSNQARALGYKIFCALDDIEKRNKFVSLFNTTEEKLRIACERGVILTVSEMKKVAEILNLQVNDLLTLKNTDCYKSMVNCRGKFSSQGECEKMLNLIDAYIELEEAAKNDSKKPI